MAFDSGGAAGGAGSGAAAGSAFGPWGTAIGAVGGGLIGGFMGGKKTYQSPHFSDIDLQRENPELWAELQKLQAMADHAEALYNQKVTNDAAIQTRQVNAGLAALDDKLASSGLLGTSAGLSTSVDAEQRLKEQIARKTYEEQQAAMQAAQSARINYINQHSAAQQGVFNPMLQESQMNFQHGVDEDRARNQFITSGIGAAASAFANQRNQTLAAEENQKNRDFYGSLYSGGNNNVYPGPSGYNYYSGFGSNVPNSPYKGGY